MTQKKANILQRSSALILKSYFPKLQVILEMISADQLAGAKNPAYPTNHQI